VKLNPIVSEREFRRILSERLLESFPGSRLASSTGKNGRDRLRLSLVLEKRRYPFQVEAKSKVSRSDLIRLQGGICKTGISPLIATVSLPDSLFKECRKRKISCFDCNGRAWIQEPGLSIFWDTNDRPYRVAQRDLSPFTAKSQRLARLFLNRSETVWSQVPLSKETGLSLGLISRLLNHYEKQGWIEGRRKDWRLVDRDGLLDAWVATDRWSKRIDLQEYDFLEPDKERFSGHFYRSLGQAFPIAFTQWLAATLRHPYGNVPVVSAYCGRFPTEAEGASVGLRRVPSGGKIWLLNPIDPGVFRETRVVNGIPLVSDAQIYLDLLPVGLRGPDQAEALRKWEGFCR
jgi:hypothetical protein